MRLVKKKVLLVGIYDTNSVSLAPHVLKAYVSEFEISRKYDISTIEFSIFVHDSADIVAQINDLQPDLVGFSVYIWNYRLVLEVVKRLDCFCVLGGPQVTGVENELLAENSNIDIVVTGEGEHSFKEILEYFAGVQPIEHVKGITTKTGFKSARQDVVPLDSIPSPYRKIFDQHDNLNWIAFESSRGCPFGCTYCTWGYNKELRYQSLDRVFADLDIILRQPSIDTIYFCDSNILVDKKRSLQILGYIIENGPQKAIRFEFNAEHLDDEIISLLGQLKNNEFNFGIQSTNPRALKEINRKFDQKLFERNFAKIARCVGDGQLTIDLIYGLPGDDPLGYRASLDYAIGLTNVSRILTNPLIVLPGSVLFVQMDRYGIEIDKGSYIIKKSHSFSADQITWATKLSFYVSCIYLNRMFVKAVKEEAGFRGVSYTEFIEQFMDTLKFDVSEGRGFPLMIPATRDGFEQRNRVFLAVIESFHEIITSFHLITENRYLRLLARYDEHFSDQYKRLQKYGAQKKIRRERS